MKKRMRNKTELTARNNWIKDQFRADCKTRERNGYKDAPLSAPAIQKDIKIKYGVNLNSQQLYDLRKEVFAEFKLDNHGKPLQATQGVQIMPPQNGKQIEMSANRDPNDILFAVSVVPITDPTQGEFLRDAIAKLASRGLVDENLKVDLISSKYCTVSRLPA